MTVPIKRLLPVLLLFSFLCLSGCGGGGSSSGAGSVSGSWSGSWTSSTGQSGKLTATLSASGSTYAGPATIYNSYCFGSEYATGTLSGSKLTLGISSNAIVFVGTLSGSNISGLYEVYRGGCAGDSGTFSISK